MHRLYTINIGPKLWNLLDVYHRIFGEKIYLLAGLEQDSISSDGIPWGADKSAVKCHS